MTLHRALAAGMVLLLTSGTARAEERCYAPMSAWQSRNAVKELAEENGWHIRRIRTDDGCYEVSGRDADGQEFHADIDPATLEILYFRQGHGRGKSDRHDENEDKR
ncbi:MAG: PepSY domain-containing protein [Allorhizobium sp.]